jgi:hypothetical protein
MAFELWGFGGGFQLDFPSSSLGFTIIGILVLALAAIFLSQRERESFFGRLQGARERTLILLLITLQLLFTRVFIIRLDLPGFELPLGNLSRDFTISFALFAAIPWLLASGFFGVRH